MSNADDEKKKFPLFFQHIFKFFFQTIFKMQILIIIFGFSTKNAFKWVQTTLVLVHYFLRYPLEFWGKIFQMSFFLTQIPSLSIREKKRELLQIIKYDIRLIELVCSVDFWSCNSMIYVFKYILASGWGVLCTLGYAFDWFIDVTTKTVLDLLK